MKHKREVTPIVALVITIGLANLPSPAQQLGPSTDLNNFASVQELYAQGDYESVVAIGERLLLIEAQTTNQKDPQFSKLLLMIANSNRALGNANKAGFAYKRAISALETVDGRNRRLGAVLERYACFLQRNGNKAEAYDVQKRALAILAPSPEPSRRDPVTGTVVQGQRIDIPQPNYPVQARRNKISGSVSVVALIDETGKPLTACAESGDEVLAIVAEEIAFRARFTPTTLGDIPVRVNAQIVYKFVPR
jgi:tetratricopeptide (TPR) repeat protein